MIHVELSVAPRHRVEPPHTIIDKEFERWHQVRGFVNSLGLNTDSKSLETVCNNPNNEYVQVELEVLEVTGQAYTSACLSIEGQEEEPLWEPARRIADLIDEFVDRVAKDTNTHDGKPRGIWNEGPGLPNSTSLTIQAKQLADLADLWEDG